MPQERKRLLSVLLVILSTLGFLIGMGVIGNLLANENQLHGDAFNPISDLEKYSEYTIGFLALTICTINAFTLVVSIRYLRNKNLRPLGYVKSAVIYAVMVLWFISLGLGYVASQSQRQYLLLGFVTTLSIWLPIWLLVNIARSGLLRSTRLRELGALTLGLTLSPVLIIFFETIFLYLFAILIFMYLGIRNPLSQQLLQLVNSLANSSGGLEGLGLLFFDLQKEPLILFAVFLILCVIVPLIEEILKPVAIWFLLKRPLYDHEGYALGLISGGAFALLESAGLAIQMKPAGWLRIVTLRAATGVLHIGLSGIVGFGLVRSKNRKEPLGIILFILAAAGLHGAWNFLSLYSGLSAISAIENGVRSAPNMGIIISIALMVVLFVSVIIFNFFINRFIRRNNRMRRSL